MKKIDFYLLSALFCLFVIIACSDSDFDMNSLKTFKSSVFFDGQGGAVSGANPISGQRGDVINLPSARKYGYDFQSWLSGGKKIETYKLWDFNDTLIAAWQPKTIIITYDTDGGDSIPDAIVKFGNTINLPTPEKYQHRPIGWFYQSGKKIGDTGSPYEIYIESDITMFARWEKIKYTITFRFHNGTKDSAITEYYGTKISLPSAHRIGYDTLNGWFSASSSGTKIGEMGNEYTITKDEILHAQWTANTYTISFDTRGGNEISPQNVRFDSEITLQEPKKSGHTFVGWFNQDGEKIGDAGSLYKVNIASDITIYAQWQINPYTITLNFTQNGVGDSLITAKYGTDTILPTPNRTGYTFGGWYSSLLWTENTKAENPYKITNDITLHARWIANIYTISFDTRGGNSIPPENVKFDSEITLQKPEKSGHTFVGWFDEAGENPYWLRGSGLYKVNIDSDITMFARWEKDRHTITFRFHNGAKDSTITEYYGTKILLPSVHRIGYDILNGWFSAISGGTKIGEAGNEYTITKNETLHAQWTPNIYTISFVDSQGGNEIPDTIVRFDDIINLPIPTRDRFEFIGWFDQETGGTAYSGQYKVNITNNITMYARWERAAEWTISGILCVWVEGGTFTRHGRTHTDNPNYHIGVIDKGFYISKYPITKAQYEGFGTEDSLPKTHITQPQASDWARKQGGRLPKIEEWEFAAAGGRSGAHLNNIYSGSNDPNEVAWHRDNSSRQLQPVGRKKANELKIHDMSGNVWEWTSWICPDSSINGMPMGGGFDNPAEDSRVFRPYYRHRLDRPTNNIGFRIVFDCDED